MQRLVLIDGNAILHRAYHALPPLTNRSGEQIGAVYGFSTMLFRVIAGLKPNYLAVVFDLAKPTFRHHEYFGYQSHRPKMDLELVGQIDKVHEVLKAMGVPIYGVEGFEADDVIGTIAKQSLKSKKGKKKTALVDEVIIVTGDRDLFQLIGPKTKVYAPARGLSEGEIFDQKKVYQKMKVRPDQIVDYKGLSGDASDNYPGVPGVGPKTAASLLQKYKTFKNLFRHVDGLPENLARKLTEGVELAELSRKLAQIVTDVPFKFDLHQCEFKFTDEEKERLTKKFKELGFKSLIRRLEGSDSKAGSQKKEAGLSKSNSQQELF